MTDYDLPDELASTLSDWISLRIKEYENLRKLSRHILEEDVKEAVFDEQTGEVKEVRRKGKMSEESYMGWQMLMDEQIENYKALRAGLLGETVAEYDDETPVEPIMCIPKEVKSRLYPFLKGKALRYKEAGESRLARTAEEMADTIRYRVPPCTASGNPSTKWIKKRGYEKDDFEVMDNLYQVVE